MGEALVSMYGRGRLAGDQARRRLDQLGEDRQTLRRHPHLLADLLGAIGTLIMRAMHSPVVLTRLSTLPELAAQMVQGVLVPPSSRAGQFALLH